MVGKGEVAGSMAGRWQAGGGGGRWEEEPSRLGPGGHQAPGLHSRAVWGLAGLHTQGEAMGRPRGGPGRGTRISHVP